LAARFFAAGALAARPLAAAAFFAEAGFFDAPARRFVAFAAGVAASGSSALTGAAAAASRAKEAAAEVLPGLRHAEAAAAHALQRLVIQREQVEDEERRVRAAQGETEQRLYALNAWRETTFYTERERAALALTEAITLITDGHVSDAVYKEARRVFDEKEVGQLIWAAAVINTWNRLAISARSVPAPEPSAHS
jgi:alkylhydroperoxidase family enzyme